MTKQGLKHGFTLIETLVVVCVIGVLASLVIPRLTQQSKKAKLAEVVNMIGVISRAQNIHRQTKEFALGICPSLQEGMNWV